MQGRVTRGGGQGAWAPPLEIEKQKKKKKVIRANIKLLHLYFATFLVENPFSQLFSELGPPPEKLKSKKKKKKKLSNFGPPLL